MVKILSRQNQIQPIKSQETLTWHSDTFFTGLLRENGVGIAYDRENSIFIDRDPHYFKVGYQILNYFQNYFISFMVVFNLFLNLVLPVYTRGP